MSGLIPFVGTAELLALGSSLVYSFVFISMRKGLASGTPLAGVLTVNVLSGAAALSIAWARGTLQDSALAPVLWFMAAGFVGQGLGHIFSFTSIQRIGASRTTPVQASSPMWTALFAVLFLGESPEPGVLVGLLLTVSGVTLVSLGGGVDADAQGAAFRRALVLPVAASLMYGTMPILTKMGYLYEKTPFVAVGVAFTSATGFLLLTRPFLPGEGGALRADGGAMRWFLLGALCAAAATMMFWTSLTMGDASVLMPLSRTAPLWVVAMSYLFLGDLERVTSKLFLAAVLVVVGGVLIMRFG